jgi:hypothetical protein
MTAEQRQRGIAIAVYHVENSDPPDWEGAFRELAAAGYDAYNIQEILRAVREGDTE